MKPDRGLLYDSLVKIKALEEENQELKNQLKSPGLEEKVNVLAYELDRLHKKVNPPVPSSIDFHFNKLAEWIKELV